MSPVRVEREQDAVVVTAHGELDAYSAPTLESALTDAASDERGRVVIDLSRVSFLDSTALGIVVRTVTALAENGGSARLVLPETTARRIFEITTLDRVLPTSGSRAKALEDLRET